MLESNFKERLPKLMELALLTMRRGYSISPWDSNIHIPLFKGFHNHIAVLGRGEAVTLHVSSMTEDKIIGVLESNYSNEKQEVTYAYQK